MKSPDLASRALRFEADEKVRKVSDLEQMIREFEQVAIDLDRQIQAEEERTGVRDPAHYNYSTFARSAAQRRDNLRASAAGLKSRLGDAVRERDEFLEQMERLSSVEERPTSSPGRRMVRGATSSQSTQLR
ncbi:MAG: flagellar export protein FliJ [Hyphomicrobiaceae bacterium]|nr:flagellar export protein FliJ [Hyphomicrobiaceae bacterium]